jgi:energy-coupling factor transport system substrate-specific component
MTTTLRGPAFVAGAETRWRTRDIVVAAVIGVAFGVVFWAWGLIYAAAEPLFAFAPPLRDVMYGVWLIPAVLAPLVIRKPGAALFTEMVSLYRSYGTVVLVLAAVASALAAWVHDWVLYYPTVEPTVQVVRLIVMVISAAMITAGGSVLLARSLRRSGVLDGFPA